MDELEQKLAKRKRLLLTHRGLGKYGMVLCDLPAPERVEKEPKFRERLEKIRAELRALEADIDTLKASRHRE